MKEIATEWAICDPFNNEVDEIEKSNAMDSYLWELYVLLHHYDPNVVDMMKKLRMKLIRARQQFNAIVNST